MQSLTGTGTRDRAYSLFVACRSGDEGEGLYRWDLIDGAWQGTQLAGVPELSALTEHPFRQVVYGVSAADEGRIYAWDVSEQGGNVGARLMNEIGSGGADACHVAVDPAGGTLVAINFGHGSIAVQRLAADGSFEGTLHVERLHGSSVDSERQEAPHPHQAIFHEGRLYVTDLGADLLREYELSPAGPAETALTPVRDTAMPPGTGPRHAVVLPDGRFAISGELASTLVLGTPGDRESWVVAPSTSRVGPAKTRHARNYPGDIQATNDGRLVHIANRGYDTITTYDVTESEPRLISEMNAGVAWPQHLLVDNDSLLVAGWDSSCVVALPLADGRLGEASVVFDSPGAAWLLASRHPTTPNDNQRTIST